MYMYMRRHYRVIIRYILQSIKVAMNALALSKIYTDIKYICSTKNPRLVGTTCMFFWCKYSMGSFLVFGFSIFGYLILICDFRFFCLHKSNANCLIHQQFVQTNPGFGMELVVFVLYYI